MSIFGSKNIKKSIDAVNMIVAENSDIIASSYVADKAKSVLKADKKRTDASINEDGLSHRELALLVMSNVISNELTSGEYHIYRGSLNTLGQSMRQLWPIITNGLIAENQADPEIVKLETADLDAEINSLG